MEWIIGTVAAASVNTPPSRPLTLLPPARGEEYKRPSTFWSGRSRKPRTYWMFFMDKQEE